MTNVVWTSGWLYPGYKDKTAIFGLNLRKQLSPNNISVRKNELSIMMLHIDLSI